ncbi:Magnesium transport protein CorA [Thiorhodovibrio winogradskyi]|uniref:Magnesium transport protein CorA n=2 Tax=Thiorhodovibrio winogradskyi TaxID=77007 RepID=A0ABZ0S5I6_9GAMM
MAANQAAGEPGSARGSEQASHQPPPPESTTDVVKTPLKGAKHARHAKRSRAGTTRTRLPRPKGSRPGTPGGVEYHELIRGGSGTPVRALCTDFSQEQIETQEIKDIKAFLDAHRPSWCQVRWIHVEGLDDHSVIRGLAEKYQLHPLAIEDLLEHEHRAKLEDYPNTGDLPGRLFVMAQAVTLVRGQPLTEPVAFFLGRTTLLSFKSGSHGVIDEIRHRIQSPLSRVRQHDASFLFYVLIDAIVDHSFPVLDACAQRLEDAEDQIFSHPDTISLQTLHAIKRDLVIIRRTAWPMRELVIQLLRDRHQCLSEITQTYLRDVYDHCTQIIDLVETYREIASAVTETYTSIVSNRTNDVMKVLTIIGTIFLPLTFLAGVEGMNLEMPEAHWPPAYPLFWLLCILIAGLMLWHFKRKGWLWQRQPEAGAEPGINTQITLDCYARTQLTMQQAAEPSESPPANRATGVPMSSRNKTSARPRSVQAYIDETPFWQDGTSTPGVPLTRMQWRIWILATAGKFFEGLVVFMTGVALPLIVMEFQLDAAHKGVVGAAVLAGILIGATALGGLADVFGRKRMFIVEMILFAIFLAALTFSPSFPWLVVFLFGMGMALGCDYPTAHLIISESIPSKDRGKLVLSAFGFQAVGALVGTIVGYLILNFTQDLSAWRWMYATAIIPTIVVIIGRFFITDSGHWLLARGRVQEAETALHRLLERDPAYPKTVCLEVPEAEDKGDGKAHAKGGFLALFNRKNRRATLFASIPWFLQDLGTYGIGIFTPTILAAALGHHTNHEHNIAAVIHNDILAAKGAALLDLLLLFGIIAAVLLADKVGRVRLQVFGFIGCAIGLALAAGSMNFAEPLQLWVLAAGFVIFNFMTNLGPNAQTYLIAGEVFPTHIRGQGAGFAASFAKIGAVLTAFCFPIFQKDLGTQNLLLILVGSSLLGALITWLLRIETKGRNLEDIGC